MSHQRQVDRPAGTGNARSRVQKGNLGWRCSRRDDARRADEGRDRRRCSSREALTREALDRGSDPEQILDDRLVAAMDVVGQRFSTGEMYVPEMLVAARAMKACIAIIRPFLADKKHKSRGTVVIGTVKGDIHDVGKNLVSIMLEGAGFEILDLGVDVAPDRSVQAVDEHSPDIVALSSLLTTTMPGLRDVINELQASGVRDKVKVMVGGAPVTDEFARGSVPTATPARRRRCERGGWTTRRSSSVRPGGLSGRVALTHWERECSWR